MASIGTKINIVHETRPCLVFIPHRSSPPERRKALFHGFVTVADVAEQHSHTNGGHSSGQLADVFAVVEFEDGQVYKAPAEDIRFLDSAGKFAEYDWSEEAEESPHYPSEKKKPVDAPPLNCQGCRHWPKPTMVGVQEPCRSCGGVFTGYKNWEPKT